ncbi:MAG: cytochrome C [Geobacteraceae bacterium GWC2_58_44]|nr:MAG: cytochrome C [Geobacteraceae bacterium GWC2_58_44]HBG06256.1 cytochrome C [Geobacter sp.]
MRRTLIVTLALTLFSISTLRAAQQFPSSGSNLGSVTGGDFKRARLLIEKKCTACHTDQRIREALAAGRDMQTIQRQMEKKGVTLSADERTVLGVFWKQTPLKKNKTDSR